jgi:DNA replication protein DnaC
MPPRRTKSPAPASTDSARPGVGADDAVGVTPVEMADPEWQREFYAARRLERARIPARFAGKTLETFSARDKPRQRLVEDARVFIAGFNLKSGAPTGVPGDTGLRMQGPVGCGKSHLAVAILREVIKKAYSGLYYNSPDLMRDLRATIDRNSETTEDSLLEEVTSTDLLVFDDIGAEKMTEYVLDRFYLIVNERYEMCKPIIVTTNLSLEDMEARLGKRITSRIIEMCAPIGPFPDEDWRRRMMQ